MRAPRGLVVFAGSALLGGCAVVFGWADPVEDSVVVSDGGAEDVFPPDSRVDTDATDATDVPGPIQPKQVALGATFGCLLDERGALWCWGNNDSLVLGDAGTPGCAAGGGSVRCSVAPVRLATGPFADLTAGPHHACVLDGDGRVLCVGTNGRGELGHPTTSDQDCPAGGEVANFKCNPTLTPIVSAERFESLSRGPASTTCAVTMAQQVVCWGANKSGQVIPSDAGPTAAPTKVDGLPLVAKIVVGSRVDDVGHACAKAMDSTVWCWGSNDDGAVAGGSTPHQVSFPAPRMAMDLATGSYATCALTGKDELVCWGLALNAAPGGDAGADIVKPRIMSLGPVAATAVSAGSLHMCVSTLAQGVLCFGSNGYRQLGDWDGGPNCPNGCGPVQASSIGAVRLASGLLSQAIFNEKSLWTWGFNFGAAAARPPDAGALCPSPDHQFPDCVLPGAVVLPAQPAAAP